MFHVNLQVFNFTLRFGQVNWLNTAIRRIPEETPQQKPLHYITGYGSDVILIQFPSIPKGTLYVFWASPSKRTGYGENCASLGLKKKERYDIILYM